MRPAQLDRAVPRKDGAEGAGGSAIAIYDDDLIVARRELRQPALDGLDDLPRIEVVHGGNTVDIDLPTMPVDDGLHLLP